MLEGGTKHWWGLVKHSWEELGTEVSWGNVLESFNEKYFPNSVQERKEVEFIKLQQGNLSLEQYAAKFIELSRYAPNIINTEAWKVKTFERGIRPKIRGRVISVNFKPFSPLVHLALKIKRDYEESRVGGNWRTGSAQLGNLRKKTRPPPLRKNFKRRDNQRDKKIQRTLPGDIRENRCPTCPHGGKDNHSAAECQRKKGACFKCGKPDH
ncbi:uncharacterized protein LOC105420534 [Amborella trichopoda]|uniref:uncharacterized protein LOC105420534 n=1 Tax=Amborella trichopoda TaxID=13333 RepID=UPI0005D2F168|nr:uncharacterized protein LOC105420534 [Amborella trichopoda]|eukprot:XP_011622837.1 uncharacterized protein LOC105420534 [Amborella trichopoda]